MPGAEPIKVDIKNQNIKRDKADHGPRYECTSRDSTDLVLTHSASQYELASPPGDAISSVAFSRDSNSKLLVSSWDKSVYLYDILEGDGQGTLVQSFEHQAPVLDVCFGANDSEAFSCGLDWQVVR